MQPLPPVQGAQNSTSLDTLQSYLLSQRQSFKIGHDVCHNVMLSPCVHQGGPGQEVGEQHDVTSSAVTNG